MTPVTPVTPDDILSVLLRRWPIGPVQKWESLYHKGTVLAVTAESGERFVLKEVAKGQAMPLRLERLKAEHQVLLYLHANGVPAPAPLTADNGLTYIRHPEDGDTLFTLHPMLPNSGSPPKDGQPKLPTWEQPGVWSNVGAAIGRLHRTLAVYPGTIPSWHMVLPERVRESALPTVRSELAALPDGHRASEHLAAVDTVFDASLDEVCDTLADLPEQYLHGDCHGGNILIADGDVSGFIDLDHLPLGAKVYDLSYLCADRLKWRIDEPEALLATSNLFPHLVTGYEREFTLTPRERGAIWPGMLATQLFFIQAFVQQKNEEHITRNVRALTWIYQQREAIKRLVSPL